MLADERRRLWFRVPVARRIRRVLVYSSDGKLLSTIAPDGRHPKILQRPFGLLFDGQGHLYVTDYDADQIQVFNADRKFLFAWGREGKGKGGVPRPGGD